MIERRSALAAHPKMMAVPEAPTAATDQARLVLSERRALSVLQVSAFASTAAQAQTALASALGLPAPQGKLFSGTADKSLRCVGPGVWLVVGPSDGMPDATSVRAQLGAFATVVDLSHARCALQLRGAAAARTLAKVCGLDLDPSVFPTGSATNTRFGHIGMHLARTDDGPTFELLVFRGYAEFVFEALCDGAAEFGLRVEI
ncbi:MAG: sarcosine oxidase subunit gamma family protein [Burkholderiaceae bacterium]